MKKLAFLFLSFLSIGGNKTYAAYIDTTDTSLANNLCFDTEQCAQDWIEKYIISRETRELKISIHEVKLIANCLFIAYQIIQLDELARYYATNKLVFHIELIDELKSRYGCILSSETHDAFCTTFNCFKKDLIGAYQAAEKRFYTITGLMEQLDTPYCAEAYNALHKNSIDLIRALHTNDNYLYKRLEEVLANLSQERAQLLLSVLSLESEMPNEFIKNLSENDQEIVLRFIAFQEECTNASKDFFRIYLNTLLSAIDFPIMIMFEDTDLLPSEKQTKKLDMISTCRVL